MARRPAVKPSIRLKGVKGSVLSAQGIAAARSGKQKDIRAVVKAAPKGKKQAAVIALQAEKKVNQLDTILRSIRLRMGGAEYSDIARSLGITESQARNNVMEEMQRLQKDIQETALEHRQLQLQRLNAMLMEYWTNKDSKGNAALILTIMNRMDELQGVGSAQINLNVTQSAIEKMSDADLDDYLARRTTMLAKPVPNNFREKKLKDVSLVPGATLEDTK